MEFLHTMVRISDIDESLRFYCDGLGLEHVRRVDVDAGRFTLVFLAAPRDIARVGKTGNKIIAGLPMLELTYNWPDENGKSERYGEGRNFGHLAFYTDDIYQKCRHLMDMGVIINRPPRDGRMAFVRSPDNISVELLQSGNTLPPEEPWQSMENEGVW